MAEVRGFPADRLAAMGIGGAWIALATAETLLLKGQDALDDVSMIGDNYWLIAAAGFLHACASVLLVVGLAGVAPLLWASASARVGWFFTAAMATGLGSFAMVHILALETAAAGLDGPAMNRFLVERLGEGTGPWTIPVLFVALLGPWSVVLLLFGLTRVRRIHWISPALFAGGAVAHMLIPGEIPESTSLWVMAVGGILAANGILRSRTHPVGDVGVGKFPPVPAEG
ncbi:hypothetical protein [Paeniglutamicibacter cryotolerans]|uniref:DUF4386 family protein n=1 Tax=Paeniglutamicibacter cryotolerans TaxID=670079 RepID=A0A839QJG1_9MICC|nr:hypothetical protein [Paeniglutamicibacter cryotolerans]MBB2996548.1 hypothetical protein [Paeniglutamicibacter cryotolerans]